MWLASSNHCKIHLPVAVIKFGKYVFARRLRDRILRILKIFVATYLLSLFLIFNLFMSKNEDCRRVEMKHKIEDKKLNLPCI